MSLPSAWVDKLFAKLTVTYGADFLRRYDGIDLAAVKADWAEQLAGYERSPEAIAYALSVLPADKPPTVLGFMDLCRRAPIRGLPALPAPAPDPEVSKAAMSAIKRIGVTGLAGPREWAFRLRDRERQQGSRRLTKFQRDAWREALGLPTNSRAADLPLVEQVQ